MAPWGCARSKKWAEPWWCRIRSTPSLAACRRPLSTPRWLTSLCRWKIFQKHSFSLSAQHDLTNHRMTDSNITPDDPELARQADMLLLYLKRTRGIDLSGYKRPSLLRRIVRRMEAVKIEGLERYID